MDNDNRQYPPGHPGHRPLNNNASSSGGGISGGNYQIPRQIPRHPPQYPPQRPPFPVTNGNTALPIHRSVAPPVQSHYPQGQRAPQHFYQGSSIGQNRPGYQSAPPSGHGPHDSNIPKQAPRPPSQYAHKRPVPPQPHQGYRTQQQLEQQKMRALAPPPSRIKVKSENPFLVRVRMSGVPLNNGGIPRRSRTRPAPAESDGNRRSSSRTPKRNRLSYVDNDDLEDTDSDFSDDDRNVRRRIKKDSRADIGTSPAGKNKLNGDPTSQNGEAHLDLLDQPQNQLVSSEINIDSPPPGVLPSLWYSRECVLHVFAIEKILGWKTRPIVKLNWTESDESLGTEETSTVIKHQHLDPVEVTNLSAKYRTENTSNQKKRMETSRINPAHCPVILTMTAAKEERAAKKNAKKPKYTLAPRVENEREEVLLIKWRGRSHLHCSWERRRDLERFDPSNNTAKGKIKRYYQSQELILGNDWKRFLEEGRASATHAHVPGVSQNPISEDSKAPLEEDFFPVANVEVERILACDESEMNMDVLSRQRALNIRAEQEALKKREIEVVAKTDVKEGQPGSDIVVSAENDDTSGNTVIDPKVDDEIPWDPEDNVRYVVKWKGLQVSDITWEYWKDIKHDGVDQAEDFWHRQKAPDIEEAKLVQSRPIPHVRDFKKLRESPLFGVRSLKRPIANLGDGVNRGEFEDTETSVSLRLRGYQLEGVNWLLWNWWNRRSCILADEMGLGKTIQSMCFLDQLMRMDVTQVRGPFLIVAPLSLIAQWQSESAAWAPDMNSILYHGSADARDFLVKQEFYYTDQFVHKSNASKLKRHHVTKFQLLITTYEVVLKDIAVLSKIKWKALIIDEAHRLKNDKARLFSELLSIPRDFCVLLTGTPLQNSTEELWSLLHFSDPIAFASKESFVEKFGQLKDAKQVSDLHTMLKPYLLRRVKEDVEKSLPPKEETILEVSLTPTQKKFYKAIYERNTAFLFKGAKPSNSPSLMNVMMELRKCCNHPFLIRGAEERIITEAAAAENAEKKDDDEKEAKTTPIDYPRLTADQLVKSSGKMVLLEKLLPKLQAGGHKVLIFSQMVRVLDLLEELLRNKQYRYERLDGGTSASARAHAVDRFHKKSFQRFVMLLSTRAGGLGLNLTAADTIIIYDSDWNPQNDLQAMARAHRIGQTRAVRVYRLLTAKTYEMHMFHSASMKLGLDRAVLAHQRQQGGDTAVDSKTKSKSEREVQAKEIDQLLKKGAYDVFRDEDDKEAQQFMETDIDQLLEQTSRKVTYGDTNTSMSSGLGSFSKASFVASSGDASGKDVDLDDPNFWEKAVGLDAPVETSADMDLFLEDGQKRTRKQVQQFDPYAEFHEAEQKKRDKVALKLKEEKDEKDRIRMEKRKRKLESKEKRKRERQEHEETEVKPPTSSAATVAEEARIERRIIHKEKSHSKEGKGKKMRKAERRRALRRAEKEDPILERIKQAWEVPQRNRATSASLRFGFGRFCKIRNEANLTSIPLQDLEIFVRAYLYQLGLQAGVSLLNQLAANSDPKSAVESAISSFLLNGMDNSTAAIFDREGRWICDAIMTSLQLYSDVKEKRRSLRMPLTLAEPHFISELRGGAALRALRRLAFLSRLNGIIERALDSVLSGLGPEELGKRGCPTKDLSTLDIDLKSRHVTTEELSHVLGTYLVGHRRPYDPPSPWWDRCCDLALVIGSFAHGLGNYESIKDDDDLPFSKKIDSYAAESPHSSLSYLAFDAATKAGRNVFDNALGTAKAHAQAQAHAAVAAALAASKLTEEGSSTDTVQDGSIAANDVTPTPVASSSVEAVLYSDQSDVVTLDGLSQSLTYAIRTHASAPPSATTKSKEPDKDNQSNSASVCQLLPMPDGRVLDTILLNLMNEMEDNLMGKEESKNHDGQTLVESLELRATDDVFGIVPVTIKTNTMVLKTALSHLCPNATNLSRFGTPTTSRVDLRGFLCGSYHRTLDEGMDFSLGAATPDLAATTCGADASRYKRGPGVPMIMSRFFISALVHSDSSTRANMISMEKYDAHKVNPNLSLSADLSLKDETPIESDPLDLPENDVSSPALTAQLILSQKEVTHEVPPHIRSDDTLRASLCIAAFLSGGPPTNKEVSGSIDMNLVSALGRSTTLTMEDPPKLFTADSFFQLTKSLLSKDVNLECDVKDLQMYFDHVFLPHCLRLCAKAPDSRVPDGTSKFTYNAVRAIRESPIPDPCVPIKEHSEEAVMMASTILRRTRLARSIRWIASGNQISTDMVLSFLHGPVMREDLDGVPIWWCPWIHDLALLVHAAQFGLLDHQLLLERRRMGGPFEVSLIQQHVRATFCGGNNESSPSSSSPKLPKALLESTPREEMDSWVTSLALEFPSLFVMERRLAVMCGHLTSTLQDTNNNEDTLSFYKYDNIPMFDHGGWPVN